MEVGRESLDCVGERPRQPVLRSQIVTSSLAGTSRESPVAKKRRDTTLIPPEQVDGCILLIRGEKVLLDADLAELYGVATKVLTQAVRRNLDRFPEDFMFQLSAARSASPGRTKNQGERSRRAGSRSSSRG
ncbi:MAG: ORF6N domain-containing protein [Planctomycetes bacterium]|nr:ORF6N domain-containing protein [Planctomycetota bacterium]